MAKFVPFDVSRDSNTCGEGGPPLQGCHALLAVTGGPDQSSRIGRAELRQNAQPLLDGEKGSAEQRHRDPFRLLSDCALLHLEAHVRLGHVQVDVCELQIPQIPATQAGSVREHHDVLDECGHEGALGQRLIVLLPLALILELHPVEIRSIQPRHLDAFRRVGVDESVEPRLLEGNAQKVEAVVGCLR